MGFQITNDGVLKKYIEENGVSEVVIPGLRERNR